MKKWEGYQKGINLGGWFSQCDYSLDRFENFIKKEDIAKIAGWGMDHVRMPIDYNLVQDKDGNYKESGFGYIDRIISWCKEYGLNMILDLHKTAGYSFDAGEAESGFFSSYKLQERFYQLWEEFARRYSCYTFVSFELLNEITDPAFMPDWNRISSECIRRIRAIAPTTYILVGGFWNNSVQAVSSIDIAEDPNVIYNFHCYDPLVFTHQGAPWIDGIPNDYRIHFDETYDVYRSEYEKWGFNTRFGEFPVMAHPEHVFDEEYFEMDFADAIAFAQKKDIYLYCGEFGVIDLADPSDALKWYRCILKVLKKYEIGFAAWSYREMDFGLVDEHMDSVRDEIIKAIIA